MEPKIRPKLPKGDTEEPKGGHSGAQRLNKNGRKKTNEQICENDLVSGPVSGRRPAGPELFPTNAGGPLGPLY